MKKYLGVKVVSAQPMTHDEAYKRNLIRVDSKLSEDIEGYAVVYEDGYESWSPKDVFEKAYKEVGVVADQKEQIGILVNPSDGIWDIVGHTAKIKIPKTNAGNKIKVENELVCGRLDSEKEVNSFKEIEDPAIENRIGFIKITPQMFHTKFGIESLNALYEVVTPLRSISYDRCIDAYERMMCYCEQFREIKEGDMAPEYIATLTCNKEGEITLVEFKEKEFKIY